jgi:flavoprotein
VFGPVDGVEVTYATVQNVASTKKLEEVDFAIDAGTVIRIHNETEILLTLCMGCDVCSCRARDFQNF